MGTDEAKPVLGMDKATGQYKKYPSLRAAAKSVGGQKDIIKEACEGKVKSAYGCIWEYAE